MSVAVTEVLGEVNALGGFFAVGTGEPPAAARPLRELYATGPGTALARRVATVAGRLGTAEPRVAASVVHLGLAARLWSVTLGAAALGGVVPELRPDRTYWQLPEQGLPELWVPDPIGAPASASALHRLVVVEQLTPLAAAVRAAAPVSERLLWGNAASALTGASRMLPGPTARGYARDLLTRAPLAGTLTPGLRRRSCCLYYRLPNGGLCGDCVFTTPPGRA
ncbi:(2Fe-2S)-binding protein [Kitasatospora sp. NPDC052896]|uniref:(2Fe-2S)-binding protein n=1 Tax=Kitasatospora sp. NPDC052896 TaxID=3364061 RepID=UPI0037C7FA9C